jgi:hypothetical protein
MISKESVLPRFKILYQSGKTEENRENIEVRIACNLAETRRKQLQNRVQGVTCTVHPALYVLKSCGPSLTPWCSVLFENLIAIQPVTK